MGAGLTVGLRETPGSHMCPLSCPSPLTPSCRPGVHAHYTDGHLRPGAESLSPWDTEAQQVHRVTGDRPATTSDPSCAEGSCFSGPAGGCLPATHVAPVCYFLPSNCTPALLLDVSEGVFQSDFSSRARTGLCGEGRHTGAALPPGERSLPPSVVCLCAGWFVHPPYHLFIHCVRP